MPGTPGQCQGHTKDQKSFTKAPRPKALNPAAKRPLSDFNFFCRDARKLVVEAHPEYTKEQVNKELGRIWSMLDHNSRQHYRVMYVQDKQRYSKDVAAQSSVASSTLFKPNGQTTYSSSPIGAGTSNSHNGGSSSARVRNIIWRCATERSCVSTEGPSQMAARSSMEFVVSSSSNNIDDNGAVLNNASSGFLLQRHPANQQVRHPSPMYRSNTIKSILNDSSDYGGAKETTESDDVDEPLARALARGSGRSSNLPSIYHPLREHRLRETAAAMARNQASDS
ncbi:high mobility group [Coemansia sp. RSA 2599]|nr:high mobility group [Coemansia sp. RSA 2599]